MATKLAHKRLTKEFQAMQKAPPPFIYARFDEKNILDWHFIIAGPPDSPYAGGQYHGIIMFPSEYPFKPPDIKFYTPSGRFAPGEKICFSMTSFHPSTWNAAWSVATILTGALSFMLGDEITTGSIRTTDDEKRRLAKASHGFNCANKKFRDIFPEYAGPTMKDLPDMGQQPSSSSSSAAAATTDGASAAATKTDVNNTDGDCDRSVEDVSADGHPSSSSSGETTVATTSTTTTTTATATSTSTAIAGHQPPIVAVAAGAGGAGTAASWYSSRWRWILAALAVIILGRISSSA